MMLGEEKVKLKRKVKRKPGRPSREEKAETQARQEPPLFFLCQAGGLATLVQNLCIFTGERGFREKI